MPLRILIADDHKDLREMLRAFLETRAGWLVCGEAANGLEAVQKAIELNPDVAILDLSMPGIDGLKAATRISSTAPHIPILIYTNYAVSPESKLEAKKHGVSDILNKEASPPQLIAAVEKLLSERPGAVAKPIAAAAKVETTPAAPSQPDPKDPPVV